MYFLQVQAVRGILVQWAISWRMTVQVTHIPRINSSHDDSLLWSSIFWKKYIVIFSAGPGSKRDSSPVSYIVEDDSSSDTYSEEHSGRGRFPGRTPGFNCSPRKPRTSSSPGNSGRARCVCSHSLFPLLPFPPFPLLCPSFFLILPMATTDDFFPREFWKSQVWIFLPSYFPLIPSSLPFPSSSLPSFSSSLRKLQTNSGRVRWVCPRSSPSSLPSTQENHRKVVNEMARAPSVSLFPRKMLI